MRFNFVLFALVTLIVCQVHTSSGAWVLVAPIAGVLAKLAGIVSHETQVWTVVVQNKGHHSTHLWCASKDDRIGDASGLKVRPGEALAWSFRRAPRTQFWCTLKRRGQQVKWDVYFKGWKDAPNPTKWFITDDGVYTWDGRKWENLKA
ncbi:hypothetical protein HDE_07470 [Halotydeus destructor]|nr:hypothetical protein HDE_07470 [Halotydeus destructor]